MLSRRRALVWLGILIGLDRTALAQRLGRPLPARLTIDLGQYELIEVAHPIFGRERYAIDPAEIARALAEESAP